MFLLTLMSKTSNTEKLRNLSYGLAAFCLKPVKKGRLWKMGHELKHYQSNRYRYNYLFEPEACYIINDWVCLCKIRSFVWLVVLHKIK